MPQLLAQRLEESLDVSGAFNHCFFHACANHLLVNKMPLPEDLFTFRSLMGGESAASKLQKRFPNKESLSLFAEYAKSHPPENASISPDFIVEKTLVLSFLLREWFATKMFENTALRDELQVSVLDKFKIYQVYKKEAVLSDLFVSGEENVLYIANQAFLEYFSARPTDGSLRDGTLTVEERHFEPYFIDVANNSNKALEAFWKVEGYKNYCGLIANSNTKLAANNVKPAIEMLNQSLTIHNDPSLFLGAICKSEAVNKTPFTLLLNQVDHLKSFVSEHQQAQKLAKKRKQQRKIEEKTDGTSTMSNQFELDFYDKLALLAQKMYGFKGDQEFKDAFEVTKKLHDALKKEGAMYFGNKQPYQKFKENCDKHILDARPELDKHRGLTKIIVNILAIIFSAGIGYAIAAGINIVMNKGKFTFFSTDSALKIDEIEKSINNAAPTA